MLRAGIFLEQQESIAEMMLDPEVQASTDALGRLEARLAEICPRSSGSRA